MKIIKILLMGLINTEFYRTFLFLVFSKEERKMVFHQECTMYTFRFLTDDIKYAFVEE